MRYFSEREEGEPPREREEFGEGPWGGILALILARINDGSFGACYPVSCADGHGPTGCDESAFWRALQGDVPGLLEDGPFEYFRPPRTLDILDTIEFCWRCVGHPAQGRYHNHFDHYHLRFDIEEGRVEFRESINRIFRRKRLAPPGLREALASSRFFSGESELDRMLEKARCKFLDPDEFIRREALEVLWDAWERLKTLDRNQDKKAQVVSLLDRAAGASSPALRGALGRESKELTWIGNHLQIRHSETTQERLVRGEHVDYFFHRLFALIQMILRTQA